MENEPKLLGYYNYTVILTYIGMLIGFVGIVRTFEESIYQAMICLMLAGVCDMFDGTIASTRKRTKREKCFGIQIDSLSDLICFGLLPALITYKVSSHNDIVLVVSAIYALCALIRLAYFNVDEQERQERSSISREVYYGLPVTFSAVFVPLVFVIAHRMHWGLDLILSITLIIMAALFLSPFSIKKPKFEGKIKYEN